MAATCEPQVTVMRLPERRLGSILAIGETSVGKKMSCKRCTVSRSANGSRVSTRIQSDANGSRLNAQPTASSANRYELPNATDLNAGLPQGLEHDWPAFDALRRSLREFFGGSSALALVCKAAIWASASA